MLLDIANDFYMLSISVKDGTPIALYKLRKQITRRGIKCGIANDVIAGWSKANMGGLIIFMIPPALVKKHIGQILNMIGRPQLTEKSLSIFSTINSK